MKTRPRSPLPWRDASTGGGIVCDDPLFIDGERVTGREAVEYYGGNLVCESMQASDVAFVLEVMEGLPRLIAIEQAARRLLIRIDEMKAPTASIDESLDYLRKSIGRSN